MEAWLQSPAVGWAVVALLLVGVELVTGTFYLLVLGAAAGAGALAAWGGLPFGAQCVLVAAAAIAGLFAVRRRRRARAATEVPMDIDAGQTAAFEAWVSEPQRVARVKYRGAPWTARVAGDTTLAEGTLLRITAARGSTLEVTPLA
jgi:membrane protein implicated in regulation of membrane protease activity